MAEVTPSDVEAVLNYWGSSREHVLSILQDLQRRSPRHFISQDVANQVAQRLDTPPAHVYELITFYEMLHSHPHGRHIVEICESTPCYFHGGRELQKAAMDRLGIEMNSQTPDGEIALDTVPCFGRCAGSPAIKVDDRVFQHITPAELHSLIAQLANTTSSADEEAAQYV